MSMLGINISATPYFIPFCLAGALVVVLITAVVRFCELSAIMKH